MPMARGKAPWTAERRQQLSETQKANWAAKKREGVRRIPIRTTVHIFKECLATLDLLRGRFETVATLVRSLDDSDAYEAAAVAAVHDAAVVQRAYDALLEVVVLKQAIELPESPRAGDPVGVRGQEEPTRA